MKIDRNHIRRIIGEPYFSRGEDYFQRGRVAAVEIDGEDWISGLIAGSGRKRYRVEARLTWTAPGVLRSVAGECTCPIGFNCKHVAALLLAAEDVTSLPEAASGPTPHGGKTLLQPALPGAIQVWLDHWSDPGDEGRVELPATKSDRLFYVFRRGNTGMPEIVIFKAYVKKDGTIGASSQEYNSYGSNSLPAFATIEDATILARLRYFAATNWPRRYRWPDGDVLRDLLFEIIATGRARLNDVRGLALTWIGRRPISVRWEAAGSGEQRLTAWDASGAALDLLAFPVPVFTDAATGETGFAETELPAGDLVRLIAAPPIPAEAVGVVAEAIANMHPDLPRPKSIEIKERKGLPPVAVLSLFGVERKQRDTYRDMFRGPAATSKLLYPCAQLRIAYDGADDILLPGDGPDIRVRDDDELVVIRRDVEQERQMLSAFEDLAARYEGFHPDLVDFAGSPPKRSARLISCFRRCWPMATSSMNKGSPSRPKRFLSCGREAGGSKSTKAGPFIFTRAQFSFIPRSSRLVTTGSRSR